jgi:hypothetical protein
MDDPKLNSLDRFRKKSNRLILEEHSHCEVPAGCGGVVLRWRDNGPPVPVHIFVFTRTPALVYLDGVQVINAQQELPRTRHTLAIHLSAAPLSDGFLMVAVLLGYNKERQGVLEPGATILTADDQTWHYSLEDPADPAWMSPTFEQNWKSLVASDARGPGPDMAGGWQFRQCQRLGAVCLGLPEPRPAGTGPIWILRQFEVRQEGS